MGFGIRASVHIWKGDYIIKCTGKLLKERPMVMGGYMKKLNVEGKGVNRSIVYIGGKNSRNLTKFINYSCEHNTVFEQCYLDGA